MRSDNRRILPWALTFLAVVIAWSWRNHRWRERQRELEAIVARRTAELAAQNAELVHLRQIEFDEKLAARLAEHKARLEVLRYQLNPHFLFNTLNTLSSFVLEKKVDKAEETLLSLSEFLRYSLARFLRFWLLRLIYEQQDATK